MHNTITRPIVLYASEAWTLTKELEAKLMVFENNILRRIYGPIYDHEVGEWRRRHNQELRDASQQPRIIDIVKRNQLRWAGHVARMPVDRIPRKVMLGQVDGRRPRGRPRLRWQDGIRDEVLKRTDDVRPWMDIAEDRRGWRQLALADRGPRSARDPPE